MKSRSVIFVALNVLRFISAIALILVFSSQIVVLVNDIQVIQSLTQPQVIVQSSNTTQDFGDFEGVANDSMADCDYLDGSTIPNQPAGAFWAVVNRFLIIFEIIILFFSEIGWPQKFFTNYFPMLGRDFGLGVVGVFECLIGASVLSHHIATFPLVSAFFLFSIGCLNIIAGLVWRESSRSRRSISEWKERVPDLETAAARAAKLSPIGQPMSMDQKAPISGASRPYAWGSAAVAGKTPFISKPIQARDPFSSPSSSIGKGADLPDYEGDA